MDTLVAFHRSAKRNTALRTASLRGIANCCLRWFRSARLRESPANGGKCAEGDSNSHGPNGPQGPQPCARHARPFLLPPKCTFHPGRWTIWTWRTGRLLSRCCHVAAVAGGTRSGAFALSGFPTPVPWSARSARRSRSTRASRPACWWPGLVIVAVVLAAVIGQGSRPSRGQEELGSAAGLAPEAARS